MTNEEKLKILLDKAIENGFKSEWEDFYVGDIILKYGIVKYIDSYKREERYSLNDLVLNTNFFECLFKKYINDIFNFVDNETTGLTINGVEINKIQWCLLPVESRLEWLFNQFNI